MSEELSFGLELPLTELEYDEVEHSIVIPFAASLRRDRIGDFLDVDGIDTSNHIKNPVAYLDHGKLSQPLPVGKTMSPDGQYTVWIKDGIAWAKIYLAVGMEGFPPPTPELVFELYKGGYLKAGSIGYRPLEAERIPPDPENGYYKQALWLKKTELQEVTICGLPMNQDTVKSYLEAGINGKPLTPGVKSLLCSQYETKTWSQGVDMTMKTKEAMSATDASQGGSFVAPPGTEDQTNKTLLAALKNLLKEYEDEEDKPDDAQDKTGKTMMTKAEDTADEEAKPETEEEAKSEDKPDVGVTLEACKSHLEEAAYHPDTPDDLREEHAKCAKEIGDYLEKSEGSNEDDDSDEEEYEDLDLEKVKSHLDEACEKCSGIMKSAHKYHADQLEKCMGKSEDEEEDTKEEDMSEEDGTKILGILDRIGKRLGDSEKLFFKVFGS